MQISTYTNFGRVHGHNHRIYKKKSLNVSLKGSPKGVFPTKKFYIKIFILKFAKNTNFTKKLTFSRQKFCSQLWKLHRQSLICYQETHILLEVSSTDYLLSMGNFRGISSLSKGWPLFLAISLCLLLEGRLSLHGFVCDRVVFSLNKECFRYCEKTSFWGNNRYFGNSRFS